MSATIPAIRTSHLGRVYRLPRRQRRSEPNNPAATSFVALENVDLEVPQGELFGLLGSNGAGKTTLIKILTTLLAPSSGSAWVQGFDVVRQPQPIRQQINMVSGGETSGYGVLTVRENLWLFSQLYGIPSSEAQRRIDALMDIVSLSEKADTRISHLSTGLRQKMNFCRGFMTDPRVLFLDEPTLGLDVTSARTLRQFVRSWMTERPDRTLVLTTHYMVEADELCDRVAVIDRGRVLACDTPAALKRRMQRYPLFEIALAPRPGTNGWHELGHLPGVHHFASSVGPDVVDLKVALREEAAVGSVVQQVVTGGSRIVSLKKVEPTLEDVFVELVGHGLAPEEVPA
jgi:ABC-2 type transport system ATP-binding protein